VDLLALTRELVAIDSTTGREGPICRFVGDLLSHEGYRVTLQEVTPGRWNVYAHRGKPAVVFSTHLDTVPPHIPPQEDGDRLAGRGTCDAKGIAAAMIAAARQLTEIGAEQVGLLFLVGEEHGSDGALAAARLEPRGRALIGGEPTGGRLVTASRGALRVRVRTAGRSGHSSLASGGESAIERLVDLLGDLRGQPLPSDPELGSTTYNVGVIAGGVAANVVADDARAEIMFRTVEREPALRDTLARWAAGRGQVEVVLEIPPMRFDLEPGFPTTTVSFTTDLPLLEGWGRRYLVGPGPIERAHTADEFITRAELEDGVRLYAELGRRLLAPAVV
jgi:acetylornithine deacetylase